MSVAGIRLPRSSFRPKVPLIGGIGGILFGEGIVVLLQQYAVQPLTQSSAIAGLVVGLALAVAITTVVRLWSNAETNRAIAAAEARINATIEARLAASGLAPTPDPGAPPVVEEAVMEERPTMDEAARRPASVTMVAAEPTRIASAEERPVPVRSIRHPQPLSV